MPIVKDMSADSARLIYQRMQLIRKVEEAITIHYREQEMRCPVHLSIGQEAVSAALCAALREHDHVFGSYRGHALYLAKGGDPNAMMAELYGRKTGVAGGKSGSMQLAAPEVGFLCASALVGGTIPIGVGDALAAKLCHSDRVSAILFGDAATEEGVWHEAMNFASLKKLPVIFMCENNFFAVYTHIRERQPDNIHERGAAYAMPGVRVDGNNAEELYNAVSSAVARAREGHGPTLIEARTYRWREHCGPGWDDHLGYRNTEEAKSWMAQCPIKRFERILLDRKIMTVSEMSETEEAAAMQADGAIAFAKASPFPDPSELTHGVYAP